MPQPSQRPDPAARTCNHANTAKIALISAGAQAVGACSPTAATAAGQRGGSYSYRSLRSRPMTQSERSSSRAARSAAPDRKYHPPARGNESARKQAGLPVAKSAQGAGTSQVSRAFSVCPSSEQAHNMYMQLSWGGKGLAARLGACQGTWQRSRHARGAQKGENKSWGEVVSMLTSR